MNTTHIQVTESASSASDAEQMLASLAEQVGYVGGRVLPAGAGKPDRVQAFFADDTDGECWLPDGMRRVFVPDRQRAALGILDQLTAAPRV